MEDEREKALRGLCRSTRGAGRLKDKLGSEKSASSLARSCPPRPSPMSDVEEMGEKGFAVLHNLEDFMKSNGKTFNQVMENETWEHTSPEGEIEMIKASDFFEHLLENDITSIDFLDSNENNSDDPVRECMKKSLCVDE